MSLVVLLNEEGTAYRSALPKDIINGLRQYGYPDLDAMADAMDNGIKAGPHEWRVNEAKRLWAAALGNTEDIDE